MNSSSVAWTILLATASILAWQLYELYVEWRIDNAEDFDE